MTQPKDKSYYLDWIVRAHEEGCQRAGRSLSEDGEATLREIWDEVATELSSDPKIFRFRRAAAAHVLAEAGDLMARSAQYAGHPAVESSHVCAGTIGLHELGRGGVIIGDLCDWFKCTPAGEAGALRFHPMSNLLERAQQVQARGAIRPT